MARLQCSNCLRVSNAELGHLCPDCGIVMRPTAIRKPPGGKPSIPHKRYRKGSGKRMPK